MQDEERLKEQLEQFRQDFQQLQSEISQVIVGQQQVLEDCLIAMIAGGHVLLEGVPGLGKTLIVRTLAEALRLQFRRIQFTPDLMPADLTGTNVIAEKQDGHRAFEFQRGPVFSNILLADEINRATPRTQSALLEAMQEHSVTVAGVTHRLAEPFFVMATQNPLEMEGTYPLPEAQLDRFFCKLIVPFPSVSELETILDRTTEVTHPVVRPVLEGSRIIEMSHLSRQVPIASEVRRYAIDLTLATHPNHAQAPELARRFVRYGASPRGLQSMILGARIRAILKHRYHVAREDLRAMARPALRHRLILNFEGQAEGITADQVVDQILSSKT